MLKLKKLTLFVLVIFGGFSFMTLFSSTSSATSYKGSLTNDKVFTNNSKFQKHTKIVCNILYKKHSIENDDLSNQALILEKYLKVLKIKGSNFKDVKKKKLVKYLITILSSEINRLNNQMEKEVMESLDFDEMINTGKQNNKNTVSSNNQNNQNGNKNKSQFSKEYNNFVDDFVDGLNNLILNNSIGNTQLQYSVEGGTVKGKNNSNFTGKINLITNNKKELELQSNINLLFDESNKKNLSILVKNNNVYTKKFNFFDLKNHEQWFKTSSLVVEKINVSNLINIFKKGFLKSELKNNPIFDGSLLFKSDEYNYYSFNLNKEKFNKLQNNFGFISIDKNINIKGKMKVYSDGKRDFELIISIPNKMEGSLNFNKNGEGNLHTNNLKDKNKSSITKFSIKKNNIDLKTYIMNNSELEYLILFNLDKDKKTKGVFGIKNADVSSGFFLKFEGEVKKVDSINIQEPKN